MSGSIEEVPLPDLLQLFGTSKKSGVLVIRTGRRRRHASTCRRAHISFAIINDLDDVPPLKSLFRMLTWQKGLFDLEPPDEREFPNEMNVTVQEILMEGMRQLDEFNRIREELPDLDARLSISAPLIPPLRDLKPEELDVLQLAHNYGIFETVLNKSLATDLETAEIVLKLIKASYLRVGVRSRPASSALAPRRRARCLVGRERWRAIVARREARCVVPWSRARRARRALRLVPAHARRPRGRAHRRARAT